MDTPYNPTLEAVSQILDTLDEPTGSGHQHQQTNEWTTPVDRSAELPPIRYLPETPGTARKEMEVECTDGSARKEIPTMMAVDDSQHQTNQPSPNLGPCCSTRRSRPPKNSRGTSHKYSMTSLQWATTQMTCGLMKRVRVE